MASRRLRLPSAHLVVGRGSRRAAGGRHVVSARSSAGGRQARQGKSSKSHALLYFPLESACHIPDNCGDVYA